MFVMPGPPDRHYYRMVKVGQTVKFPCHTKLPEDVNWVCFDLVDGRETFIYLGKLGPRDLGLNPRFDVLDKSQSHSLVIYNVTLDDSAIYRCAEDSGLGLKHFYLLNVDGNLVFLSLPRSICLYALFSVSKITKKVD